jgi:hypothetical protein
MISRAATVAADLWAMPERDRAANPIPAVGGGAGAWAEFNRRRVERLAARTENLTFVRGSRDLVRDGRSTQSIRYVISETTIERGRAAEGKRILHFIFTYALRLEEL